MAFDVRHSCFRVAERVRSQGSGSARTLMILFDVAMKIGVIGYGYWGPNLVRNFAEVGGAEVKWCVDKRLDRRTLVKRRYPSICVAEDAEEVFDDPEVRAVVIATPVSAHYELARRALERGKHVLVEKPMTR